MANFMIIVAIGIISIAVYVSYPAPQLSQKLLEWKNTGKYFMWSGKKIFYIDMPGAGSAETLICLHGYPTNSFDWVKILPTLKKDYSKIVMLDFLGFGFSDKPTDITYTIGEQADIVENLALDLGVNAAHVLSHDYGDTVALELLERHNSRKLGLGMLSLTMLNGGIFPNTHHPRWSQKLLLTPVVGHLSSYLFNHRLFRRGFGEVFGANQPSQEDFDDFWTSLRFNNGDRASYKIMNFLRERQQFKEKWVGALSSTQVKVLMIYGPADPVNPPEFAAHFKKVVPSQKLVVLDSSIGHYPQWEDPEGVSDALHEFVKSFKH